MKKLLIGALLLGCIVANDSFARGGFSSGGRGGFSVSRSYAAPSRSYTSPSRTTTRTTTTTRSYGGGRYYGGYGYHPMMYPGFGYGYGYHMGLLDYLIIGELMHPQGTTVYNGGGYTGGSALLYPDGRVVDQNGNQVGTYLNGQFTSVNGGFVAQHAPADAIQQQQGQSVSAPIPVTVESVDDAGEVVALVVIVLIVVGLSVVILNRA